jgi:DNA processing protein
MEPEASLPWLALTMTPGKAARLSARLLREYGTPEGVFHASLTGLESCNLTAPVAQAIYKKQTFWRAEKEVAAIRRIGCRVVSWSEPEYPQALRQIYDPPVLLYVRGDASILNSPSLAIVGTRRPTVYGTQMAERMGRDLAKRGLTIVSGLARGVDAIAHQGTTAVGGRAIGVLGTGIDVCYPKENKKLYEKVLERGAIISEFPTGFHPAPENFPVRNRIRRDAAGRSDRGGQTIQRIADYGAAGDGIWQRGIGSARECDAGSELRAKPVDQAGGEAGDKRRRCDRRACQPR